ncbi:tetratricopeptide repeat protein [Flavobacterium sp. 3-210]
MGFNNLIQFVVLLVFTGANAQKQEIKSALRELKEKYPQRALNLIASLDYKILNASDEQKSDYFYIKGVCNLQIAENTGDKKNLSLAVQAFNDLILIENSTKLFKYSETAKDELFGIERKLANQAAVYFKEKKYDASGKSFLDLYELDKNKMCYLYYSAFCNLMCKNYSSALRYFTELKKKNYSGKVFSYYAVRNDTGKDEQFGSRSDRDKALKNGTHRRLFAEMEDPKKENLLKNIIILNLLLGNAENAKQSILEFKNGDPEDHIFDLAEFKLYLETRDYKAFEKILIDRSQKEIFNADLNFYLGIVIEKLGRKKDAKKYFKKVLEIDPLFEFKGSPGLTSSMEAEKIFAKLNEKIYLESASQFNP